MSGLAGTAALVRLALRRDRWLLATVLVLLGALTYPSVLATFTLFPDEASRVAENTVANASTAVVAMYGTVHDLASVGGLSMNKLLMLCALALAFIGAGLVRRHTRTEEESGRFELLGAAAVGRRAPLAAAVLLALGACLAGALVVALSSGLGGMPWAGSAVLGGAVLAAGVAFTGLAAVAVQLTASTRAAGALAFGAVGIAFALRMIGDVRAGTPAGALTWLSPLGWAQQMRPFDGDRWWPGLLAAGLGAVCLVGADALRARRDLGAGLLPDRAGRAQGRLRGVGGLALRLHRGSLIGWGIGFALVGAMLGTVIGTIGGLLQGNAADLLQKLGGAGAFDDAYISMFAAFAGVAAACFGTAVVLRLHTEETSGHAEYLLATPTSRPRLLWSHAAIAVAGTAALLALVGLTFAAVHALAAGDASGFWREASPSLAYAPAALLLVAAALLLVAALPRLAGLAWALVVASLVLGELGALLSLPGWVQKISPFAHVPKMPFEAFDAAPLMGLTLVALALAALATLAFRRRDVGA